MFRLVDDISNIFTAIKHFLVKKSRFILKAKLISFLIFILYFNLKF